MAPLLRATKVIGIAPVKDHNLALASMTMKNWYGLLGGPRNRLHQRMDQTIATLASLVRPTLSVLDGSRIMIRNGPTGGSTDDLIAGDTLAIAHRHRGARRVRRDPARVSSVDDLPYLRHGRGRAARARTDYESLQPREIGA